MSRRRKEPGHEQPRYLLSRTGKNARFASQQLIQSVDIKISIPNICRMGCSQLFLDRLSLTYIFIISLTAMDNYSVVDIVIVIDASWYQLHKKCRTVEKSDFIITLFGNWLSDFGLILFRRITPWERNRGICEPTYIRDSWKIKLAFHDAWT